jgi:crotonobetainyl-CoA:carnitine CoA-transferase CaiB-like acyl-CoA transferase
MTSVGQLPLAGLRVLELGQLVAGPYAGRLLAEFGADVIKVEPPITGDPLRSWRQLDETGTSLWWYVQNRNKRCITLDLRKPEGQALARKLAASVDVVIENFRPGTLEKWGLSYEQLAAENPGLIMLRISGFGQTGPYRDKPGFGSVGETLGGVRNLTGWPDRPPTRIGLSFGDTVAGLYGVVGLLAAVYHRKVNGGQGQVIDAALYESVFALTESLLPEYDRDGLVRERTGNSVPGIAPSNTYPTSDDKFIVIGGNGDSIFQRLCQAIGRPELCEEPILTHNAGRSTRQEWLDLQIADWTQRHTLAECQQVMDEAGVPAGPIYSIADIAADPHYQERGMLEAVMTPSGPLRVPGIVPKLSGTPGRTEWVGPPLGAHNLEVYTTMLGITPDELATLQAKKVI